MQSWRKAMAVLFAIGLLVQAMPVRAASASDTAGYSADLADMLLILSGTAAVFDSPRLDAALQDPQPYLVPAGKSLDPQRVQQLLKSAGFHEWIDRPRLWIVQPVGESSLTILSADSRLAAEARYRALPLSTDNAVPLDTAVVKGLLAKPDDGALQALLAEHKADALVVVETTPGGYVWHLMASKQKLSGTLALDVDLAALLPHLLSEELATPAQWPEAGSRALVRVGDLVSFRNFSEAQTALRQLPGARGLSLVRLDGSSAWFALDAPVGHALTEALRADNRFLSEDPPAALKPLVQQARQLAGLVQSCAWAAPATASKSAAVQ